MQAKAIFKVGGASALAVALLAWLLWPSAIGVSQFVVVAEPLVETIEDEGRTHLRDSYTVAAPIAGFLQRVQPEPGDAVEAGQTLFVLEPSPAPALDARAREQAAEAWRAAQARLTAARAEQDNAAAEARFAEGESNRVQALFERGLVSATEHDQSIRRRERAQASERVAQAAAEAAGFELEMARSVLEIAEGDRAPDEARRLRVLAPISGLVMQRQRCCEGPIAAGEAVLTIGNLDALEVVVDLLSSDAVRVEPGMAVRLQSWGGDQTLNGQVRRVSPAGFTRVSALGVDEQRVSVHVELLDGPEQWARLGEGYRVQASFVLWSDESVLQVPSSALFRHQGEWQVFVVEQGRARLRAVTRGRSSGLRTGIEAGLSVGESVIVRPSSEVADGTRVRAQ